MESLKSLFWKPDPTTQFRKCNALIRANTRKLDRDISQLRLLDSKTRSLILSAAKRGQRHPPQKPQADKETRLFAKELLRIRKQTARLATSKAQLQSVGMQVNEAFSVRKIEGSMKASTSVMKDVNTLVRLPELMGTMRELSQELVKAGIIEEMVGDSMPENGDMLENEDEEAETEVDKVLGEILSGNKVGKTTTTTGKVQDVTPKQQQQQRQEVEEEGRSAGGGTGG